MSECWPPPWPCWAERATAQPRRGLRGVLSNTSRPPCLKAAPSQKPTRELDEWRHRGACWASHAGLLFQCVDGVLLLQGAGKASHVWRRHTGSARGAGAFSGTGPSAGAKQGKAGAPGAPKPHWAGQLGVEGRGGVWARCSQERGWKLGDWPVDRCGAWWAGTLGCGRVHSDPSQVPVHTACVCPALGAARIPVAAAVARSGIPGALL